MSSPSASLAAQTARLTFIGAGNMAAAIIGGLVEQGYPPSLITIADPSDTPRDSLQQATGVNATADNQQAIAGADAIILAVKPQLMAQVLAPLATDITANKPLIISIAAGITLANLHDWLAADLPIIRTMPNTPALVQTGATGLFANPQVNPTQQQLADTIFNAIGIACWLNSEDELDLVVALSGSGPAYYFLLIEAMEQTAIEMGLSQQVAQLLTQQTALGAAKLAQQSDVDAAELRRRVTSPGGTTEQAVNTFLDGGFKTLVTQAMQAAEQRSKELAG